MVCSGGQGNRTADQMRQASRCAAIAAAFIMLLTLLGGADCQDGAVSAPSPTFDATATSLDVRLPEAALAGEEKQDAHLCTSIQLPVDTLHLTAFTAVATSNAVTSMMLYGEPLGLFAADRRFTSNLQHA